MKTFFRPAKESVMFHLNSLLRGEIAAVETYNEAIKHLANEPIEDLVANRNCHSKRVGLLREAITERGGSSGATSGMWDSFANLVGNGDVRISSQAVIAVLAEEEDRGVTLYRNPGDLDPSSIQLVHTVLLHRQLETSERLSLLKMKKR